VDTTRAQVDNRRHQLVLRLSRRPVPIHGDAVRLGQIASNLLNNAIKYTPPGGRISVTVEADDGDAVLRVSDTGVGISADMLPRVFDQFVQADQALDRSQGGLGLGLTLVQELAQLHGGTASAHSDGLGRGSEFVVRLPLAEGKVISGRRDRAPESTEAESRRVLIVDDNLDAAKMLTTLLESMGHRVRAVNDGTSALEAVRWFGPQVILLDIGLPGMDGYEVARRIREEHHREGIVLIALTGYGHEQAVQRSREAGFDHHLVKPLRLPSLLELLASAPG
jgi:CheY-like chemotaxis protein/anti-sigma regulatory factor (Ser/Thr protein kinase)